MGSGTYFDKRRGKDVTYRHHMTPAWDVETRFSNLNVDFDWWEKGSKVCVAKAVERVGLLEEVLGLLEFVYSLSVTQVGVLRLIYQNRRYWGLIEYTEEFEIWLAKKLGVSRSTVDVSFKTLHRTKKLLEVLERGKLYRVRWEMMPNPMELQKGEFIMINLKLRVSGNPTAHQLSETDQSSEKSPGDNGTHQE